MVNVRQFFPFSNMPTSFIAQFKDTIIRFISLAVFSASLLYPSIIIYGLYSFRTFVQFKLIYKTAMYDSMSGSHTGTIFASFSLY